MLIRIEYRNRRYDMVQDYYLEALLAGRRLRRFERGDGWVEVGRDPVRGEKVIRYGGPERRGDFLHRPLDVPIRIGGREYVPFPAGRFEPDE